MRKTIIIWWFTLLVEKVSTYTNVAEVGSKIPNLTNLATKIIYKICETNSSFLVK